MIVGLKGKLVRKEELKACLLAGGITYEVLIPRTVSRRIEDYLVSGEISLVIYHYFHIEGSRSYPVLIGFLSDLEKSFFGKILKVSGIGPKAALRALDRPVSEIASAIDRGDLGYLKDLPGIGLQRAKNIIAFLQGKMGVFTLINDKVNEEKEGTLAGLHKEIAEEAEQVMLQLQYKKKEAKVMIERALKSNPEISNLEELLNQVYVQKNR